MTWSWCLRAQHRSALAQTALLQKIKDEMEQTSLAWANGGIWRSVLID